MNAFQKMIQDIFDVPQFREYFYFQGKTISCISYEVSTDPLYAEYGVEEETFMNTIDDMAMKAFDDQCTGANPRYPLVSELKQIYLNAYFGTFGKNI